MDKCKHINEAKEIKAKNEGCIDCLKTGDSWFHLRLCLTCGFVRCCDQSKNKHATKHFKKTKHPVIKSNESGEDWLWCYIDEVLFDPSA